MKGRQSNMEALRVLAMLMIIGLHFWAYANAEDLLFLRNNSEKFYFYKLTESFFICGVNIFVLISGYFVCGKYSINLDKLVNLMIQVAFWGGIGYLLMVGTGMESFNIKKMIKLMIPFITGGRWFVKAYIIYMLLLPFINLGISKMRKREHFMLLVIMFILFCIWPSFFPFPPIDDYGYGFMHFIFLYVVISYIKVYISKMPRNIICFAGYVISSMLVLAGSILEVGTAWAYNNLFVVLASICLFMFFVQLDFRSTLINKIASCSFGVFLIHTDGFFSEIIYGKMFHAKQILEQNSSIGRMIILFFVCLPIFYLIGFVLESIRKFLFKYGFDKVLKRISIFNYEISVQNDLGEAN